MKSIGATYGKSDPHSATALITEPSTGMFDFVMADKTLCQISKLVIESDIDKKDAYDIAKGDEVRSMQNVIATLEVIGQVNGKMERRNHPVEPGTPLKKATSKAIEKFLGFDKDGVKVGHLLRRKDVKATLSQKMFNTHVSVLGMTGRGKTNVSMVLLEGLRKWKDARIVIVDPHGEYSGNIIVVDNIKPEIKDADVGAVLEMVRDNINAQLRSSLDTLLELTDWYNDKEYKGLNKIQKVLRAIAEDEINDEDNADGKKLKREIVRVCQTEAITHKVKDEITCLGDNIPLVINLKGLEIEQSEAVVEMIAKLILDLGKAGNGTYLFIDECHLFAPQRGTPVSKKPIVNLAQEGRKFGCGLVIMSQRPAKVDKDVISQCNTKFCLAMANDNDIRQVRSSTESATRQMFLEVQKLRIGECLLASPYIERPVFLQVLEHIP